METHLVAYLAAIPVRHRVEIQYYDHDPNHSGTTFTPLHHLPVICDIDTGVVYCALAHLDVHQLSMEKMREREKLAEPMPYRKNLRPSTRVQGVVVATRVVANAKLSTIDEKSQCWTELVIERASW
jgi:hypothetical protein